MTDVKTFSRNLASPPDNVDMVHELLSTVWGEAPEISMRDRFSFETALVELASNVIRHADGGAGVSYTITIRIDGEAVAAEVVDTGVHAEVELHANSMPDELAESGRGIPLIKALVDHISYDRADNLNTWQISRRFRS